MLWPREVGGLLQLVPAPLSSAMIVFRTSSPEVEKMFDPPCAAFREIVRLSRLAEPLVLWIPPPVASPPAPGAAAAEPPLPPVPPPDPPPPPVPLLELEVPSSPARTAFPEIVVSCASRVPVFKIPAPSALPPRPPAAAALPPVPPFPVEPSPPFPARALALPPSPPTAVLPLMVVRSIASLPSLYTPAPRASPPFWPAAATLPPSPPVAAAAPPPVPPGPAIASALPPTPPTPTLLATVVSRKVMEPSLAMPTPSTSPP